MKFNLVKKAFVATLAIPALTPFGYAQESTQIPPLASVGPFDFNAALFARSAYSDNVFLAASSLRTTDLVTSISPSVKLRAGEEKFSRMAIDYTPTFQFFKDTAGQDVVNHDVKFKVEKTFSRLTVGLGQTFSRVKDADLGFNISHGTREEQSNYNTDLTTQYNLSDKTSLEVNGRFKVKDLANPFLISSKEFINDDWFNYKYSEKVTTSAGFTFGYVDLENGIPHQTYEQGLVRVTYDAFEKLYFRASAGFEVRQIGGGASDRVLPVFSLGATYKPRQGTEFVLDGWRQETYAVLQVGPHQNLTSTGFSAQIRQQLGSKFVLYAGGGVSNSSYHPGSRETDQYSLRYGLDFKPTDRLTIGLFHNYRENNDSMGSGSFRENQFGIQASALF